MTSRRATRLSLLIVAAIFAASTFPHLAPAQTVSLSARRDFVVQTKPGLVVTNHDGNTVSVLLGNGDGTFQAPLTATVGVNPRYVAVGDFNGDRVQDLGTRRPSASAHYLAEAPDHVESGNASR